MELWWLVVLVLGVVKTGGSEVANLPLPETESADNEATNEDSRDHSTSSAFQLLRGTSAGTPALFVTGGKDENGNESTEKQKDAKENENARALSKDSPGGGHIQCLECIICKLANCTPYNKI